jgi:C7-C12 aromatase (ARO/CYC)
VCAVVQQKENLEAAETVTVAAPARDVFARIADVEQWPQFFSTLIHTQIEPADDATDVVRCWGVRGSDEIRAWSARRWIDSENMTLDFDNEPPPPGVQTQHGKWVVTPTGENTCTVLLSHTFELAGEVPPPVRSKIKSMFGKHSQAQLEELKTTVERGEELDELVVGWEDTILTSGDIKDAWTVLYEADKWDERIPHVSKIDMTEPEPGFQFFDMDTMTPDGKAHTTRSVRVCLPHGLIVYKQLTVPPTLEVHTGHWRFEETPDGVVLGARHTVTLRRSTLSQLGPDMTVEKARAYARNVLGTNSMKNLQIAKAYAEDLVNV